MCSLVMLMKESHNYPFFPSIRLCIFCTAQVVGHLVGKGRSDVDQELDLRWTRAFVRRQTR